jgi:hypothetical protein
MNTEQKLMELIDILLKSNTQYNTDGGSIEHEHRLFDHTDEELLLKLKGSLEVVESHSHQPAQPT